MLFLGILGGILWLYFEPTLISGWLTAAFLLLIWFWQVLEKPTTRHLVLLITLFVVGLILMAGQPFPYSWLMDHRIAAGVALALSALYVLGVGLLTALLIHISFPTD